MRPFVSELADLHRLAATTPTEDFPAEVVAQLRRWIGFDGAVLGFGQPADHTLRIATATVQGRDAAILQEYAAVSHQDPVTAAFLRQPGRPMAVDAGQTYAGPRHGDMARFARRHDLRQLLLCGDGPQADGPLRWIVLYRGTREGFSRQAVARLGAAWAHVACALDINRAHEPGTPAAAPAAEARALPSAADRCLAADPTGDGGPLSPREQAVAQLFARGLTYKQVARALHSAPNTVRVQLAQVYRKLGVCSKTALVRRLALQAGDGDLSSQVPRSSPDPR